MEQVWSWGPFSLGFFYAEEETSFPGAGVGDGDHDKVLARLAVKNTQINVLHLPPKALLGVNGKNSDRKTRERRNFTAVLAES